jgi:hypothetical protein
MAKKRNINNFINKVENVNSTVKPKGTNYLNNIGLGYQNTVKNTDKDSQVWNTNKIIEEWRKTNLSMIPDDGNPNLIGTSIPFIWSMISNIITNPSPVSISEFKKMKDTMPVISSCLTYLYSLILEGFGTYQHQNKEYMIFIQQMLNNMKRPFETILEEMLSAIWAGFYVGEKEIIIKDMAYKIVDIQPRPQQSIIFAVDSQGQLLEDGIIQYFFNSTFAGYGNIMSYNTTMYNGQPRSNPYAPKGMLDYPWRTPTVLPVGAISIPRSKCVHFAFKGGDCADQPYGISQLFSSYDWYLIKSKMPQIMYNAAYFKASPTPVFMVSPDQANTEDGQSFMDQLEWSLQNLGSTGCNPYLTMWGNGGSSGTKEQSVWIQELKSTANLDELVQVQKYVDSQMATGVIFTSELMGLSDTGSYALGESQKDLIGRAVDFYKKRLRNAVIKDYISQMLYMNFGEEKDFGEFVEEYTVSEDVALNIDKLKTTASLGLELTPESYLNMLHIPVSSLKKFHSNVFNQLVGKDSQTYGSTATFNKSKSLGN